MQSRRSTPARGTSHTPRTHTRRAATAPGGPNGTGVPGGPGGTDGTGADTRDRGTRPLTGTQRAYLTGRADDQLHGGVDCLALFEFTGAPVDPDRMRAAVAALRRHPVLRSTVVDGHHVDAGRDARPPLTVAETTGAGTRADLAAEVEGRRRDILARHADHAAGESGWVDILRWRTDDGRDLGVLHIGVSLAVADLAGTGVIVRELAAAYRAAGDGDAAADTAAGDAAGTATGPWVTFADIAAREAGPDGAPDGHREGDDATLPPDPLPAGPDIPLVGTPERTVTRHLRRLDPATWAAVGTVAGAVGATRPALLLAVYRHALGLWCGDDDLTVVVPGLDARRTPDDVLDRTRTWAVRPPSAAGRTLGEAATEAGAELRRRIRAGLDSTDEVRALLHRGEGHSGSLPFVLTCGGEETLLTADVEETFGRLTATGSVTPQVLADLQILHLTPGEVCVALDVRDGAFPATFGPELLATVADALERLAAVGAGDDAADAENDTDTAAPADLPMDRVVRVPRAVAARRAALNAVPPVDDAVATPALHGAWLRQVEARPDATAVVDPARGEDLTYAELHRAACRLAAGLADRVAPGDLVLVRLPKGCDQVTAVLAVLYLGAAYLPVNVDAPAERVRAVTEVAQPVAVLDRVDPGVYDDDPSAGDAPGTGDATADAAAAADLPRPVDGDLPRPVDGDDRAYVIFTSGSTGTPKGVVMTHRAATTTVAAVVDRHRIGPDDSVLAVSSLDFDLSVFDIFGLLGAGGAVVCIAEDDRRDAFAWCDLVRRHGVTTWNSAPALAEMLTVAAEDGPALPLRRVLVSGDWVAPTLPARVRAVTGGGKATGGDAGAAGARVVAMGGATEGGIWSNEHVIDGPGDLDPAWPSVPYGRPLPGQAYRVVDAAGRDVPTGVVGELWIGGASLAAGYLGRADLTAERFVTDADGARWYRTGDHGYWGPGDLLFFVGRRDNQVKIRGHRVELGDVEHHLRAVPGVEAAVVLPAPGNTALRALVTLAGDGQGDGDGAGAGDGDSDGDGADPSATVADRVREALAATVPGFMVPRDVTVVPELRLTANGKVDRAWAAQVLDGERTGGAGGDREAGPGAVGGGSVPGADAARAPRDAATAGDAGADSAAADMAADVTDAAADVAATWADVLDVPVAQLGGERGGDAGERAGEANFFALGGDSVAATAACSRLRALGYRVTVAELFGNPTLDRFTDAVVAAGRDAVDDTVDHAAADAADDTADDAAVLGGGADRAGAGAADGDADAGAPFPLTPLQRAYALGTDGIRGTVRAATAYAAVLGLDAAAGYGPTRAGFTFPQVKAAAAGIVARWSGLRVVRDGDDAQRVVDPSDALRVTVLDPSTDLRAHLASATPRVPLELVLPGEEARELGVLVDYLALDGRSLAVVVGALTAVLSGEDPDATVTVDPTVGVFARHCRALAAGEDRAADATAGGAGADAPDGTATGTATDTTSPATPATRATPPAAAPEPPTLPVAAGQDPSDAGADTPPAAFTSLRAHIPLATLDRAAARTGATVSAVVLAEFGSALAEASDRGEVGVVVPLTHRPDTGDDREVLGTFSRLGVCACPATPDPAATRDALAAVLTADGGVRAASAGRTGRYPAVFTSVLGYDAALAPATRAVRAVWSLTRTPGVLVDCQLTSVDAGTVEVRWDMPDGVLDAAAVDAMFRGMVGRLGGTVVPDVAEITGPLPGGFAPLGDVRPPSTVSALLREVIERLDGEAGEAGARDDALVPWAGPVVAAWRRFVAGGPEATGLADAPVAWSARDAQLLVDVVRGRARRFGILAHPVLSPRALAAAEPTVARALDVLDDRVRRRAGRGERVAVVELGHGIARAGRRGGSGGSVPGDAADSWTVVEPDALVADIATVDGRTCVSDVADVPAPADVVVACGTLHRDPRLRAGLGAVRLAPGAEVHVVEAERPTAATLVSAALVNPAVLDAAGMLSARGWAEVVFDAGLRVRYLEAEDGHSVVLRAVAAEDGEPTAGVAGAPRQTPHRPRSRRRRTGSTSPTCRPATSWAARTPTTTAASRARATASSCCPSTGWTPPRRRTRPGRCGGRGGASSTPTRCSARSSTGRAGSASTAPPGPTCASSTSPPGRPAPGSPPRTRRPRARSCGTTCGNATSPSGRRRWSSSR
ncbi:amino acid adenylation domain-containing protein [Corynebacterium bovis]|uniref:amino acid adenylation domain-containing protein n=1 Tax=Corynebacterium bovis TaxID=36808 RepID=UPI0031389D21